MKRSTLKTTPSFNTNSFDSIADLHAAHRRFHKYLDKVASVTDDVTTIELLIHLRSFNLDCIQKYTGLISRGDISMTSSKGVVNKNFPSLQEDNMTLWNIHAQLSRLKLLYGKVIRDVSLSKVARIIVSNNYDQLILVKDNLLHPIPALELS